MDGPPSIPQFPYTYISCPCAGTAAPPIQRSQDEGLDDTEEERTFDPRAPRSSYSLFPIEHLLYCEDCHQVRCPRCVLDEIVCYYCPSCLFEVPSSLVKSEGNRCTRNCYTCPVCTAPLSVNAVEPTSSATLEVPGRPQATCYVLACPHCMWSSQEVGIEFDRPSNITGQLAKIRKRREGSSSARDEDASESGLSNATILRSESEEERIDPEKALTAGQKFANLKSFYSTQITETSGGSGLGIGNDLGFGSPGALSRIMSLYTGLGGYGKKTKGKTGVMREAFGKEEGVELIDGDEDMIQRMKELGWDETTSAEQRSLQQNDARFCSDVYPVPVLLQTKRSKRCRTCRHILTRPESKVTSTRFRIRLVAVNYIPALSVRPLSAPPNAPSPQTLAPLQPIQMLLTIRNPLFDPIKVSLATPEQTPGKYPSRVTILCPQFDVGANTEVWDDALSGRPESRRTNEGVAEAGKVWNKGRNWTSVVVEVVPPSIPALKPEQVGRELQNDDDILEIPLFVHVEYEAEVGVGGEDVPKEERKEKREFAFWSVLGVGRVERMGAAITGQSGF